jgi:hypothetical protein
MGGKVGLPPQCHNVEVCSYPVVKTDLTLDELKPSVHGDADIDSKIVIADRSSHVCAGGVLSHGRLVVWRECPAVSTLF